MQTFKFETAVVIGRMQIPHLGHRQLLARALELGRDVVVVLGSAFKARDFDNPFNVQEREAMARSMFSVDENQRLTFVGVRDYQNGARWTKEVKRLVEQAGAGPRGLVGCHKDPTGSYLDDFAGWAAYDEVAVIEGLNATGLRSAYFGAPTLDAALAVMAPFVAKPVLDYLATWALLPEYLRRKQEWEAVTAYRKKWPGTHLTADAVVRMRDHVLLVRRAGDIGQGLWAFPGGFLDPDETFEHAAYRELVEETGFPLLKAQLWRGFVREQTFGHPRRSPRGRLVSQMFYFAFAGGEGPLPEVQAKEETLEVKWWPISQLTGLEEQMFEDHFLALQAFLPELAEKG